MGKHKNLWGKSTNLFSSPASVILFQVASETMLNYCKFKAQFCLPLGQPVESEVLLDCNRYILLINYLQRNDYTLKYLIWSVVSDSAITDAGSLFLCSALQLQEKKKKTLQLKPWLSH